VCVRLHFVEVSALSAVYSRLILRDGPVGVIPVVMAFVSDVIF